MNFTRHFDTNQSVESIKNIERYLALNNVIVSVGIINNETAFEWNKIGDCSCRNFDRNGEFATALFR